MRYPPKAEIPDCVVYRVQNQFKYFDNDENPVLIKAGLDWWEARQLIRELNWAPGQPLTPAGYPQVLHKLCRQAEWDLEQQKRNTISLFGEAR
ncbi:hypothetical protein KIAC18_000273 [Sporomusa sphaeroides]|uniref:hypothetical protein n=1 Tax=Sporomusa sphaeroides TaxID=47679 RepID=UPI003DA16FDB